MSVLHLDEYTSLESKCTKLLEDEGIRFAGVVNKMGNLVAGGFRPDVTPFEDDAKRRMLYMQMVLEISMRKEFDSSLGPVNYILSNRGKGTMITIPFSEHIILISSHLGTDAESIVSRAKTIFDIGELGGIR